jgi:biotin carboxylase
MTLSNSSRSRVDRGTVLILGNYRPTLTVARVLRESGYRTIVNEADHGAAGARYSRFVDELWTHPPIGREGKFEQALLRLLKDRDDITIIFPVEESYAVWLAENADRLPETVMLASPAPHLVATCLDKILMLKLAQSLGVRCHPHAVAGTLGELYEMAATVGFPVIVRPFSHLLRLGNKKAVICYGQAELQNEFRMWPANQPGLLLQRYLHGERRDLYFIAVEGRVISLLETRITRTDHPDGTGLSTEGQYVPVTPALADDTRRLVAALGYSGIGFTQFMQNPETGEVTFLELNPRTAGSHLCAQAMGLPLTEAAVAIAQGERDMQRFCLNHYPVGGYYCWLSGDLYGLKEAIKRKEIELSGAARWCWGIIRSALRARVHLTWSLRDPLPSLALLSRAALQSMALSGDWLTALILKENSGHAESGPVKTRPRADPMV